MGTIVVMTWLLSLGFVPNSLLETNSASIKASHCLVQNFGTAFYLADHMVIYSSVEIRETKSSGVYFDPFRGDFLIGGALYVKDLTMGGLLLGSFFIGVSHECNHDIVTNRDFHRYNGWEAGIDKAYINYSRPFHLSSGITITPSIMLKDQFTERIRIKGGAKDQYFRFTKIDASPNILFAGFRLGIEFFYVRSYVAFQAGYAAHNTGVAYTQFTLGAELFYKNISLGLDYISRKNTQENAGYSLEGLMLFIRFRGKSQLL